jgi:hypothetical protein
VFGGKLDLFRHQDGLEDTLDGVEAGPGLLNVLISDVVVVEDLIVLYVVEKLIPDPFSRFLCDSGARHHIWSYFDAIETLIEEG